MDEWMIDEARIKKAEREAMDRRFVVDMVIVSLVIVIATIAVTFVVIGLFAPQVEAQEITIVDVPVDHIVEANKMVATVTAYTSSVDETDSTPFETASGARTRDGIVACPARYEFGTRVLIEGVEYVCEDRMHARFGDRFDVWMNTKSEAFSFGKKVVEVTIL